LLDQVQGVEAELVDGWSGSTDSAYLCANDIHVDLMTHSFIRCVARSKENQKQRQRHSKQKAGWR